MFNIHVLQVAIITQFLDLITKTLLNNKFFFKKEGNAITHTPLS